MIKLRCISDGDKHFALAIEEYVKRLASQVQIINYKSSKKDTSMQIIQEDTNEMVKRLKSEKAKGVYVVLLSKDGLARDTDQWKFLITSKQNASQDIVFLIGWPYGFDEQALQELVDIKLSFGKITVPHGLAKLITLEQIYRCLQIISWKSYHY